MQLPFFLHLVDWLKCQPELKQVVDTSNIGVSGHSRGAKLAALHFAAGIRPEASGMSLHSSHKWSSKSPAWVFKASLLYWSVICIAFAHASI